MYKLSQEQFVHILKTASSTLRKVAQERDAALAKLACVERREQAAKLASSMHEKGLETDVAFDDLVARLEKKAGTPSFEITREAVDIVGPDMGAKLAHLTTDEYRSRPGQSDLERFIIEGDVG